LMTSRGKIQRIKCADVSTIGRNTQGVRIMGLDEEDSLAVIAVVPRDELGDEPESGSPESASPSPAIETDSASSAPESGSEESEY
ncbi:DNA gyrase subunit A, partial [Mariniblastus sp.]|nr:DNA gyrase subunit A [Mariniblastus sp.]